MKIELLGLSWIDTIGLPTIDISVLTKAGFGSWPHKVMIGLVATANTPPAAGYAKTDELLQPKQYRACIGCGLRDDKLIPFMTRIDPGYTPPAKINTLPAPLGSIVNFKLGDDPTYYPGESSVLSAVNEGKAHPSTSLDIPTGVKVIASALIKFRAGPHTDDTGINEADSPKHVPWVWSEFALIADRSRRMLLTRGSTFPSHAWYVNGQQVGRQMQNAVAATDKEPAISTGKPKDQPRDPAERDNGVGSVDKQPFAVSAGKQQSFDVSAYFDPKRSPRSLGD